MGYTMFRRALIRQSCSYCNASFPGWHLPKAKIRFAKGRTTFGERVSKNWANVLQRRAEGCKITAIALIELWLISRFL